MSTLTWKDDAGVVHVISGDITVGTGFQKNATLATSPVERGANVSDHVIFEPEILTLQLRQTQVPIDSNAAYVDLQNEIVELNVRQSQFQPGGFLALSSAVGDAIAGLGDLLGFGDNNDGSKVEVLTTATPADRIVALQDELIALVGNTPITVKVRQKEHKDLILIGVSLTEESPDEVGVFELTFQDFRTVKTQSSTAAQLPEPLEVKNKAAKDKGNKSGKEADGTQTGSDGESFLSRLVP